MEALGRKGNASGWVYVPVVKAIWKACAGRGGASHLPGGRVPRVCVLPVEPDQLEPGGTQQGTRPQQRRIDGTRALVDEEG